MRVRQAEVCLWQLVFPVQHKVLISQSSIKCDIVILSANIHLELAPAVAAVASHTGAVCAHKLLAHGGGGAVPHKHPLTLVTLKSEGRFSKGKGKENIWSNSFDQ